MARRSSRQLWADKLSGKSTSQSTHISIPNFQRRPFRGIVMGIDPSIRGTGIALLQFIPGEQAKLLHSHTLKINRKYTQVDCLAEIGRTLLATAESSNIRHVAIEGTIHVQNFQTAQAMGAARGAAIAAVAMKDIPVFEYAPLRIKQAVVGNGRASKEQVSRTVKALLSNQELLDPDEADAAAAALCHAMTWRDPNDG
jgi:crossover junction endodeoxyribonuclease RuvC